MTMPTELSILCVDDDQGVLRSLKRLLTADGHSVTTETDPLEALAGIKANPGALQLVITDLRMPGLDGPAFIQRARADGYAGEFFVVTGSIEDYDRSRFRDLDIRFVFEKPVDAALLLDAVRELERV